MTSFSELYRKGIAKDVYCQELTVGGLKKCYTHD